MCASHENLELHFSVRYQMANRSITTWNRAMLVWRWNSLPQHIDNELSGSLQMENISLGNSHFVELRCDGDVANCVERYCEIAEHFGNIVFRDSVAHLVKVHVSKILSAPASVSKFSYSPNESEVYSPLNKTDRIICMREVNIFLRLWDLVPTVMCETVGSDGGGHIESWPARSLTVPECRRRDAQIGKAVCRPLQPEVWVVWRACNPCFVFAQGVGVQRPISGKVIVSLPSVLSWAPVGAELFCWS